MKKNTSSDLLIALTVVLTSAVLLAALYFSLTGTSLSRGPEITIDLPSATGLRPHSQVRYAGNPAGHITSIRTLPWAERSQPEYAIRVVAQLRAPLPALKVDSYATISSDTILAEKFLDIAPGTESAPDLASGQPVPSAPGGNAGDLMAEGGRLLADLRAAVREVRADYPMLRDRLTGTFDQVDKLMDEANALLPKAHGVLAETQVLVGQGHDVASGLQKVTPELVTITQNAESLVKRLDSLVTTTNGLVSRLDKTVEGVAGIAGGAGSGGEVVQSLGHLRTSLENLKITSTYLKIFSEEISRQPWRLIWGTRKRPEIPTPEEILAAPNATSSNPATPAPARR